MTQKGIGALMTDMSEREKKTLFAGSVPIGLNRNQVVIGELNFNDNLYLLCTGIVRVQRVKVGDDFPVEIDPLGLLGCSLIGLGELGFRAGAGAVSEGDELLKSVGWEDGSVGWFGGSWLLFGLCDW